MTTNPAEISRTLVLLVQRRVESLEVRPLRHPAVQPGRDQRVARWRFVPLVLVSSQGAVPHRPRFLLRDSIWSRTEDSSAFLSCTNERLVRPHILWPTLL